MNQAQIKYLIKRVNDIRTKREQAAFSEFQHKDQTAEMIKLIQSGKATLKKDLSKVTRYSHITAAFDYPDIEVINVSKARAEKIAQIKKEATAIIDKLMFPSKDDEYTKELFALIKKFEG